MLIGIVFCHEGRRWRWCRVPLILSLCIVILVASKVIGTHCKGRTSKWMVLSLYEEVKSLNRLIYVKNTFVHLKTKNMNANNYNNTSQQI